MRALIKEIKHIILGISNFTLLFINTIFWFIPIFFLAIVKLLPLQAFRKKIRELLSAITLLWVSFNNLILKFVCANRFQVEESIYRQLSPQNSYLVLCNHQSWVDIAIIQYVMYGKIPAPKYFIKDQLKWIPLLGFVWWALDYPFMKRYTKQYLAKFPEKKGRDLAQTRKACLTFKSQPFSLMNFPEGTRFTTEKHHLKNSHFKKLLNPKAGGIAYALMTLGHSISSVVDITIRYSQEVPTFWQLLSGQLQNVEIRVRDIEIPEEFYSMDYDQTQIRKAFQTWLNQLWQEKDNWLSKA